ncbi:heavy metal response regulator transcription factor [Caballeronia mineralivorans]|jgi:two-component system copper resistance phosphate regulon response regulator CusR|uniref:heavy metal response regulator transcription factor n=1 Tax=Caballeronia mineralivorans TaxID=2010198 RepID=UPI0023F1EA47|nr:heavy metal response regulator transcription factor [Caballeronia mineralivorans]
MRILVIEDEQKMSSYLHKGLTEASFTVDIANDGRQGLFLALHDEFDLIVLDVMLPEIDGLEVLKRLREQKQTQVLLLTARDGLDDKVKAFELGADDYLAKPFAYAEFLARIRTLLRRAPRVTCDFLLVADLKIDLVNRRVRRGNVPLDLNEQEFALLQLLAQRRGEVLTRTFITSQIWGINSDSDSNVVDVAVGRLRAKIDSFFDKKLLHTVRGMGYVLEDKSLT